MHPEDCINEKRKPHNPPLSPAPPRNPELLRTEQLQYKRLGAELVCQGSRFQSFESTMPPGVVQKAPGAREEGEGPIQRVQDPGRGSLWAVGCGGFLHSGLTMCVCVCVCRNIVLVVDPVQHIPCQSFRHPRPMRLTANKHSSGSALPHCHTQSFAHPRP